MPHLVPQVVAIVILAATICGLTAAQSTWSGRPPVPTDLLQLWPCDAANLNQVWHLNAAGTMGIGSNTSLCVAFWNVDASITKRPQAGASVMMQPCSDAGEQQLAYWKWAETDPFNGVGQMRFATNESLCLVIASDGFEGGVPLGECGSLKSAMQRVPVGGNASKHFQLRSVAGYCVDGGSNYGPACDDAANKAKPFCQEGKAAPARIGSLIASVPTHDVPALFGNSAGAVEALKLPAYQWWSEGLHGVAISPGVSYAGNITSATSFPQVCTTAASFDAELFASIGDMIGQEGRAMNNYGRAGLTFWAPNINIWRDPRWGRGQETPGEDPLLTGTYAARFVRSMQNNSLDPSRLRVASCCKHFAGYDMDSWGGMDRSKFNAVISDADLADTYFVAFQGCVHKDGGGSAGIMCSYNSVNGVPSCAHKDFIDGVARGKWGFDGYVTSDCGAIWDILTTHHYTSDLNDTVRVALAAGTDLDCGGAYSAGLAAALKNGFVTTAEVDAALTHQFSVQMRLGMFDAAGSPPYKRYTTADVNSPKAHRIALQAARDGVTLVKNAPLPSGGKNVLPLDPKSLRKVALLGPNVNATTVLRGNYYGRAPFLISPFEGISKALAAYGPAGGVNVTSALGCEIKGFEAGGIPAACDLARDADATIFFVGNNQSVEAEGNDREHLGFYGLQGTLMQQVSRCAAGKPVVVVVLSGGSVDYSLELANPHIAALLWAGYPGQSGGQAIADVIFGRHDPAGRLPHTVYPASYADAMSMETMTMPANASSGYQGRTYRYYTGPQVRPFGHGLTYSSWNVTAVNAPPQNTFVVDADAIDAAVEGNSLLLTMVVGKLTLSAVNAGNERGGANASFAGTSRLSLLLFVKPPAPNALVGGQLGAFGKTPATGVGSSAQVEMALSAQAFVQYSAAAGMQQAVRGNWTWWVADHPHLSGTVVVR